MPAPVLMVDDEPRVLDGLRRSLHGRISIATANSGAEGLALVDGALAGLGADAAQRAGRPGLDDQRGEQRAAVPVGEQEERTSSTLESGAVPAGLAFAAVMASVAELERGAEPWAAGSRLTSSRRFPAKLADVLVLTSQSMSQSGIPHPIGAADLQVGMELCQDVFSRTGMRLVKKGEILTEMLAARLANFAESVGIEEPIVVIDPS